MSPARQPQEQLACPLQLAERLAQATAVEVLVRYGPPCYPQRMLVGSPVRQVRAQGLEQERQKAELLVLAPLLVQGPPQVWAQVQALAQRAPPLE